MARLAFRVKQYAHPKYKFVVRAKIGGKWQRKYFETRAAAKSYADSQNEAATPEPVRGSRAEVAPASVPVQSGGKGSPVLHGDCPHSAVIIIGAHRSGTSALGGALELLGVDFGTRLASPAADNEKGFWEHVDIVGVHDQLLADLRSRWDSDAPLPMDWQHSAPARAAQRCLEAIMRRDFLRSKTFGFKDPRMSRLLPLWFPIFHRLGIAPRFAVMFRHPWEVAESLARRNGIEHPRSYLLWLRYTLEAEAATRSAPRAFISFDELMSEPTVTLDRMRAALGAEWRDADSVEDEVRRFLEPGMHHHHAASAAGALPQIVSDVYEVCRDVRNRSDFDAAIAGLATEFSRAAQAFDMRIAAADAITAAAGTTVAKSEAMAGDVETLVRLDVYLPGPSGYEESRMLSRYFVAGAWTRLQVDLDALESGAAPVSPLRVDPVSFPAIVQIAELALVHPGTGERVWSASHGDADAGIVIGGTACRLPAEDDALRLLCFGTDAQFLLPESTVPLMDVPLRLELLVRVESTADAISGAMRRVAERVESTAVGEAVLVAASAGVPSAAVMLFAEQGGIYSDAWSLTQPIVAGSWQTVRFERIDQLVTDSLARLRIDPIDRPGIVALSSIQIVRDADGAVLYSAETAEEFEQLAFSANLLRRTEGDRLFLISTDGDPQLLLPPVSNIGREPCRLEVALKLEDSSPAMLARYHEALAERGEFKCSAEQLQERVAALEAASQLWESTFRDLRGALETSRAEGGRLFAELQAKNEANSADLQHITALEAKCGALENEREQHAAHVRQLEARVGELETETAAAGGALVKAEAELAAARDEMRGLAEERGTLARERAEAVLARDALSGETEKLRRELRRAEADSAHSAAEREQNERELQAQLGRVEELSRELERLRSSTAASDEAAAESGTRAAAMATMLDAQRAFRTALETRQNLLEDRATRAEQELADAGDAIRKAIPRALSLLAALQDEVGRLRKRSLSSQTTEAIDALRGTANSRATQRVERVRNVAAKLEKLLIRFATQAPVLPATLPPDALGQISDLVDARWYLVHNADVLEAGEGAVAHYLRCGAREGRQPNAIFDVAWYSGRHPALRESHLTPVQHYLQNWRTNAVKPHPIFSPEWYLATNADVHASGAEPLAHYLRWGGTEGRQPHPLFDAQWYLDKYPEVAHAGMNPLAHYVELGARRGYDPHPLFHSAWYLSEHSDVAAAGVNPLVHYLEEGASAGWSPNPLFDERWYASQNPEVAARGITGLEHYLIDGAADGRDPHPLFDSRWYLSEHPDASDRSGTLLEHYFRSGIAGRRGAHPLFDAEHYRRAYLLDHAEPVDPFVHYLTEGWKRGCRPNREFDPQFYVSKYRDVAEAKVEPFSHYVAAGKAEGRKTLPEQMAVFETNRPDFEIPRAPSLPAQAAPSDLKAIAFYLPQFHRIPQNDEWWGEGFTEWTNVRRGRGHFEGHYQPHVPSTFGYYDLQETDVLKKQAELARAAGIYGFCFYYYWFGGEVLLDLPVRRRIEDSEPDFPFCICWANENWTRRWDGKGDEILIAQKHSPEDDIAFLDRVTPIITSRNYIRLNERPLLLVYRPSLLPDAAATLRRWREHFRRSGHGELHLAMVRSFSEHVSPELYGFDAAVQFPPHFQATPVTTLVPNRSAEFSGVIYDYSELRRRALEEYRSAPAEPKLYPGVMPSWDNTARRGANSSVWVNSSPEAYARWLGEVAALVRVRNHPADRLLFINAWNEWAEGCHLEPDERYGHAWLNATSVALRDPSLASLRKTSSVAHPPPPAIEAVHIKPLDGAVKLVVSVLLYHREDIIADFLRRLLPQMQAVAANGDVSYELFLSFNYNPSRSLLADLRRLVDEMLGGESERVHFVENGFNLGFGEGHNAIFERAESDVFLTLNSDVQFTDDGWLIAFVQSFRSSDVALVGVAENASRLREDACGIPVAPEEEFDFVDASVLAIRSEAARRFGLFSRAFDYFYFEDVDLCLRYRQIGLRIDVLEIPIRHERSSSSRLLPQYTIGNVLDRNRARFFGRWGKYLTTRALPNRLGLRFPEPARQLQCAALPAVLALLEEHPTAVLDLAGLHEKLVPLFQHERIRLIPAWQALRESDYLRFYEVRGRSTSTAPRAVEIAEELSVETDFEATRQHLAALLDLEAAISPEISNRAVMYIAREREVFQGREPHAKAFAEICVALREHNFSITAFSEYGEFELEQLAPCDADWTYVAGIDAADLARSLAAADLVVTTDGWAAELAQLLGRPTFVWVGAIAARRAVWNLEQATAFADENLTCLGCHERYGQAARNVCLRGDIACMRTELARSFVVLLEKFLSGTPMSGLNRPLLTIDPRAPSVPSSQLNLSEWPQSSAASVLVLAPVNPHLPRSMVAHARGLAEAATRGMRNCRIVFDEEGDAPLRGVPHAHRQRAMAALRQGLVARHLRDERWIFWVDVDIVEYPATLIDELIARAAGGVAAPLVLMEGHIDEPARADGFGPGRFYDIGGFVENGRWARFTPPYFDQLGPVFRLDSVGSCYLVNADLYRHGAQHEQDPASRAFLEQENDWPADVIRRNQTGPANSFTEHYSVCAFARAAGLPVRAFADLIAYHLRV